MRIVGIVIGSIILAVLIGFIAYNIVGIIKAIKDRKHKGGE